MTAPSPDSSSGARRTVTILGSANVDIVVQLERRAAAGETVPGSAMTTGVGGKGVNQAVASARAGAPTRFVGTLGDDDFGDEIERMLRAEAIDVSQVRRREGPSGTAHIAVTPDGENSIVVVPGANGADDYSEVELETALAQTALLVLQAEIPVDVQRQVVGFAVAHGVPVMMTPAPVESFPADLLASIDYLMVNEHEADRLARGRGDRPAGEVLSERLAPGGWCIVTRGGEPALAIRGGRPVGEFAVPRVDVVDTTGAGDTLAGWLAARLVLGDDVLAALAQAVVAAAISVTRPGAATSVPRPDELATSPLVE